MSTTQHLLLSPAELSQLHTSLSLAPPTRPDGRTALQFRPLTAETGILPGANGSARICFADGTEAIVGVKAEVEKSRISPIIYDDEAHDAKQAPNGDPSWVEVSVEIPGYRDDDSSTVFLSTMLSEALLAGGEFAKKLYINRRFHWKLYLDIILISPPLSYPLPLLSLTSHLALLATRLPRLKSEADEDPMFDDDWAASTFLYPSSSEAGSSRPPITLLVMAVGSNIIFDPSKEELAVADSALAVSIGVQDVKNATDDVNMDDGATKTSSSDTKSLQLLSVRTIDPPSRLTAPGVPNAVNAVAWGHGNSQGHNTSTGAGEKAAAAGKDPSSRIAETESVEGVWKAPRGGAKISMLGAMVQKVLERGGVADEVLEALDAVDLA